MHSLSTNLEAAAGPLSLTLCTIVICSREKIVNDDVYIGKINFIVVVEYRGRI
jgi:hypothetical protein